MPKCGRCRLLAFLRTRTGPQGHNVVLNFLAVIHPHKTSLNLQAALLSEFHCLGFVERHVNKYLLASMMVQSIRQITPFLCIEKCQNSSRSHLLQEQKNTLVSRGE